MLIANDSVSKNTTIVCPLCASNRYRVVYEFCKAISPFAIPGAILCCNDCGMWFKSVAKTELIENAYAGEYGSGEQAASYLINDTARRFFQKVLKRVKYETGSSYPKLLDYGSGAGTLMEEARLQGYEPEGIDLSPRLADIARRKGFKVHLENAIKINEPGKYDVVTMMDFIEHTPNPVDVLRSAYNNLKPGGEIVVFTPNHRGAVVILAKILALSGIKFAINDIFGGNHLSFFDDRTLPAALLSAGFQLRSMLRFPYDPRRPGGPISATNLAIVTAAEWIGYPFGAVFRMVAFARKG